MMKLCQRPLLHTNPAYRRQGLTLITLILAAATLAACSSPSSRFYTLYPGAQPATVSNPEFLIELAPIEIPQQVARSQFVIQRSDARVDILEQERWASLPSNEIRRALSSQLTQQLGTLDSYGAPRGENTPAYRISVSVQRFESWPASHTLLDAVWSVRKIGSSGAVITCRTFQRIDIAEGYEQIVAGHREAISDLSRSIAQTVNSMRTTSDMATQAVVCPATTIRTVNSLSS